MDVGKEIISEFSKVLNGDFEFKINYKERLYIIYIVNDDSGNYLAIKCGSNLMKINCEGETVETLAEQTLLTIVMMEV